MNNRLFGTSTPNILVVDDIPENLKLMTAVLKHSGYKVRPVTSGVLALESARMMPPDLILLDINMPEMNGYEVCEQIRADAALADIPVIFLSAMNETVDKVRGLRGGGNDYVTKPFQAEEVLARIDIHLELRLLRKELQAQNELLEEKVRQRTQELTQAKDRLMILDKTKSDFLGLISHELRTPLNGIFGLTELIFETCQLPPNAKELLHHYDHSRQRLLSILDDALLLTQVGLQAAQLAAAPVSLTHVLQYAIVNADSQVKAPTVFFGVGPEFSAPVLGDESMLVKALECLIETAAKFAKPGSTVEFSGTASENEEVLEIRAMGYSIPKNALPKIFDVLAISEAIFSGGDLGLKLPLAERILSLMGGSVTAENIDPPGIRFQVRLQRSCPDAHSTAQQENTP